MATGSVKVTNLSEKEFRDMFANQGYAIPSGRSAIVPYEAVMLWCGDPEAVNRDEHHRDRDDEFHRLQVRYGALNPGEDLMGQNAPKLKVESLDDTEVVTVLEDPEGRGITPAVITQSSSDYLQAQIESQQKELEALKRELRAQREVEALPVLDIPEDGAPSRPVVKKQRGQAPRVAEFEDLPDEV